jgi:site-specific DNA recombinase
VFQKYSSSNVHEPKRVGIWIRVSTDLQVETESPQHHEQRGRFYAEAKGWQVVEVYHLEAQSGKSVMSHPETERMIRDIKAGHISGLIFSKLARLARNTRELLDFADLFRACDADLISLHESIDTSTPAGRLFYTMIAAMAQWEREEISERVAASVPIRAKLGKPLGGAAPFGYRWEHRELVPDEREAPVRRLMYELFLQHGRKKTVARLLNDSGYRTRNGSPFTDTTVDRLLRDTTAKGVRLANYTKSLGEGKSWRLKPREEWIEIPVEPIVDVELWEQVNAVLTERRKTSKKPARKPVHLFAGIAFCRCGRKMNVPSNSPKYICRLCRNRIRINDLEEIFREQLREFFLSPKDVLEYLKKADQAIADKEELLQTLQAEERKIQAEMDKLYRLYMADGISRDGFGKNYRPLENRLAEISRQIPDLQGEVDFLKIQYLSQDEIFSSAVSLYERWQSLTADEKRTIVEQTVDRITVGTDEISIELGYLPSSSVNGGTKATQVQGFIAPTNRNDAGNVSDIAAREIVTRSSSIGWRRTSKTFRSNSGNSSRNKTP